MGNDDNVEGSAENGVNGERAKLFLEATFDEVRKSRDELEQKKNELEQRLDGIKGKLQTTEEEETKLENSLKDLMKVKARFEELLGEEENLRREEEVTEKDLQKVRQKLGKLRKLYEDLEA